MKDTTQKRQLDAFDSPEQHNDLAIALATLDWDELRGALELALDVGTLGEVMEWPLPLALIDDKEESNEAADGL